MKVKQRPEDFRVEELTDVVAGTSGEFAFYRLDKTGWTTPDALGTIRRRWKIDANRLSYGGLKDRHAETAQFLTIFRGPQRDLHQDRIQLTYLGPVARPFRSADIRANRFTITLRHLTPESATRAERAVAEIAETGLANYFDDQRFGSVGRDRRFVAHEMVHGRFEEALKLALAGEYEHDRAEAKREKALLLELWGDWPTLKARLSRGHARSLVDYLVSHPTNFKGAVARLRPELQGLYLSAFQSDLWNRMLDRWLRDRFSSESLGRVRLRLGDYATPTRLPEAMRTVWPTLELPLPSARVKPKPDSEWTRLAEAVLAEAGLSLDRLRIPGMQKPFFSKGDRAACLRPEQVHAEAGEDELNRSRRKIRIQFELPRGCYATMVIKRLGLESAV